MSVNYSPVLWNDQKKRYNKVLWAGIGLMVLSFIGLHLAIDFNITAETLIIRTTAFVAISLLQFILIIGPLCRLNSSFLPLLYNRRHLGVTMFFFALIHGLFSIIQFHALGDTNPILSVFTSNTHYAAISQFPFQVLGFFALSILAVMAATSHDFWLKNLSPKLWKSLHMLVYVAYALVVLHVALGILQYESKPIYWALLVGGLGVVSGLHLIAGLKENKVLRNQKEKLTEGGYYDACAVEEIESDCAKGVFIDGENIAIYKYDGKVSAVNNVCRHQMGPLSEGKVIDGCITCPWHGYQYKPEDGRSPAPFTEKLETYSTQIVGDRVWVNPKPYAEGTFVEPSTVKA